METVLTAIISSTVSALISGCLLLFLTNSIKKNSNESIRATELEKKLIQRELTDMTVRFTSMEQKQTTLVEAFHSLKEKVALLAQKQDDFQTRLFELIQMVERVKVSTDNYGKVIKR